MLRALAAAAAAAAAAACYEGLSFSVVSAGSRAEEAWRRRGRRRSIKAPLRLY
jgi:hypothetical protein